MDGKLGGRTPTVGILAYGSLIDDPGDELAPIVARTIRGVATPFGVEFARKSASRGDAPTLVPHVAGARVKAVILVLDSSRDEAADMLWRRETRCTDRSRRYPGSRPGRSNAVQVEPLNDFNGLDQVLYTRISTNVTPLTAETLAQLAIASVAKADAGLDGISYLIAAKANGIVTPLSSGYEEEILRLTHAGDLAGALALLRERSRAG